MKAQICVNKLQKNKINIQTKIYAFYKNQQVIPFIIRQFQSYVKLSSQ